MFSTSIGNMILGFATKKFLGFFAVAALLGFGAAFVLYQEVLVQTGSGTVATTTGSTLEEATSTRQITATNTFNSAGQTFSSTAPQHILPSDSSAALTAGMRLTFDEEFNSFSRYVDAQGNTTCKAGGTGRWQTVYNFCSRTNPGNDEAEVYTDPSFFAYLKKEPNAAAETDADNAFLLSEGSLGIQAKPADQQVTSAVGSWAKYTSGIITTQFSFVQEYGYFEMRAKLPKGKGLWPAFWLLPQDQTWPPEIDAMEAFGDPNSKGEGGRTMIHYGSHALVKNEGCGGWYNVGVDITEDFHTYGVDIEPSHITYFFDGKPYATCPGNSATNKPFYMLINLAVGGSNGSWPSAPDASTVWPATMLVDYIRAYQK